jgi:hypothetical protein
MVAVELSPEPEHLPSLEQQIAAAYSLGSNDTVEVLSLPITGGRISVSFAGETGEGELVRQAAGAGELGLFAGQRASFVLDLTADGAALLWQALETGTALLHVRYDLSFEHILGDIELRVWCDSKRSYDLAEELGASGPLTPANLRHLLVQQHLAGLEIHSEQPLTAKQREPLERIGQKLLDAALSEAFFVSTPTGGDTQAPLKPYNPGVETRLNHRFSQSYPVEQHAVLNGSIALKVDEEQQKARVHLIDLDGGFFKVMQVQVYCKADFEADPIDKVRVILEYDQVGPWGHVRTTKDCLFNRSTVFDSFRTPLAGPNLRGYRYRIEVYYDGQAEPFVLDHPEEQTDALVIDVERLGILSVRMQLRDVTFSAVRFATVELEYPDLDVSVKKILDGEKPEAVWKLVVRETPKPYRYRITWVTHDDRRLQEEWTESSRPTLLLDAPIELSAKVGVQIMAAGDFTGLAQILLELETIPPQNGALQQLSFDGPGQAAEWTVPRAEDGRLRYRTRQSFVYVDGRVREMPWQEETNPILVVSNPLRFVVSVLPKLLDIGGSVRLALLDLSYHPDDPVHRQSRTLVLRERDAKPNWALDLVSPEQRHYSYRLTLIGADDERTTSAWEESKAQILVLQPIHS